jgi:hypothetical protein
MAVDKPLTPLDLDDEDMLDEEGAELEIEIINPDAVTIEDDDGGVTIDFSGELTGELLGPAHDDNLAEFIDEDILSSMASELIGDFLSDRETRKDWAAAYINGLDLLGMKIEERDQPWQGASGVYHPMLAEAVVRFQAQAMGEMFPASGPVRSKIMGKMTPEKIKAGRARAERAELSAHRGDDRVPR